MERLTEAEERRKLEVEQLARLGLEAPGAPGEANSGDSDPRLPETDSGLRLLKNSNAKYSRVTNSDPDSQSLSPEQIRARFEANKDQITKGRKRREAKMNLDRKVRAERWYNKAPEKFRSASIDDLPPDLRELCNDYFTLDDDEKGTIIFTGGTGVGKTYTAYAIMRELYISRQDVVFRESIDLVKSLKPGDDARANLERVRKARYLIVDDLGKERLSDFAQEEFESLFDYRWKNQLWNILTTNIPATDLLARYGERLLSRWFDHAIIHEFVGEDLRIED